MSRERQVPVPEQLLTWCNSCASWRLHGRRHSCYCLYCALVRTLGLHDNQRRILRCNLCQCLLHASAKNILIICQILLLSQIEVNVAIISASAPALRPLFNKTFLSSSYNQSNRYGTGYGGSGPASNLFSGHRSRPNGQIELHSFSKTEPVIDNKSIGGDISRNTSEEYILQGEGITKTVETRVDVASRHGDDRMQMTRSPF